MSGLSPEAVRRHVKVYLLVFAALAFLTVVTVAISYLHLSLVPAVCVALAIATVKGGLVAGFFMHLISEKQVIYAILAFAFFFFLFLLIFPSIAHF